MNILRVLSVAGVVLGLGGCCATHVTFTKQAHDEVVYGVGGADSDVVRLYVDMRGDLYPDGGPADAHHLHIADSLIQSEGTLLDALVRQPCPLVKQLPKQETALCKAAAIPDDRARVAAWHEAQNELWQRAAERIEARARSRGGAARPVILLIHGFNVDSTEADYAIARAFITEFLKNGVRPVFVQLHWDGMVGVFHHAWGRAQFNGPLVGLSLRRLFNDLGNDMPVRVLTHSSGAFVIAATIGDSSPALPKAREALAEQAKTTQADNPPLDLDYAHFARHVSSDASNDVLRVPSMKDLRIGMLAAATPPDSFVGSEKHPGGILASPLTLIFGINPEDQIVTKQVRVESWSLLGATSMGSDWDGYCSTFVSRLRQLPLKLPVTTAAFDFANSASFNKPGYLGWKESHSFSVYLQREKFKPFIAALLGQGRPQGECKR